MKKLKNNFSWSITTHSKVMSCARAYFWGKYGSWDGWLKTAPLQARTAYALKNLQPYYAWRGDLLHRAAAELFDPTMPFQKILPWIISVAQKEFKESMKTALDVVDAGQIPNTKKTKVLSEHFYPEGRQRFGRAATLKDTERWLDQMWSELLDCPFVQDILAKISAGHAEVLSTEELVEHKINLSSGEPVSIWIKMDLCLKVGHEIWILDWKTGNKSDVDSRQLAVYADHVMNSLGVDAKDIRMFDIYLKNGHSVVEHKMPSNRSIHYNELIAFMDASVGHLRTFLRKEDIAANVPKPISAFPQARKDQGGVCRDCQYRMLCYGDN